MHVQVLSSGSEGNATLVRAGELALLVDAGLGRDAMLARLGAARLAPGAIRHVLVTHGHLDHARSAGLVARRRRCTTPGRGARARRSRRSGSAASTSSATPRARRATP